MKNPLSEAWDIARSEHAALEALHAGIGVGSRVGLIQTPYNVAVEALRGMLTPGTKPPLKRVREVLDDLEARVVGESRNAIERGRKLGRRSALAQMSVYAGGPVKLPDKPGGSVEAAGKAGLAAVEAEIRVQKTMALALLAGGMEPAMVVGEGVRPGILSGTPLIRSAVFWATSMMWLQFGDVVEQARTKQGAFQKQVVSTMDHRTTPCCLAAHAQIRDLDAMFDTPEPPHFAEEQQWTPFHWYCRTSVVLYRPEYDFGLTDRMETAAERMRRNIAEGGSRLRVPASGVS